MSYSPSGNITNKQLYGQTLINGGVNNIDYNRDYQYNGRPHQVTNAGENEYEWDGNGNMIFRNTPQGKRYQCWDNEDRLVAVHDEGEMPQISAYLYDGGGERVWKLTGGVIQNYMNGQQIYSSGHLDKTLYASPYMVMTEQEYTKHYYIEGERICSKIGSGFQGAHTPPTSHPIDFIAGSAQICSIQLREMVDRNVQCARYNGGIDINPDLPPAHNDGNEYEILQYFYHSDHLGSASFITNAEGGVVQHLQYLPYGELFVSQRNSEEFDSRYKFTAKELDNETSYTYFGARYYDADLSSWLSVDPLSDKYPSTSAYMYCSGNPVFYKDKEGEYKYPADKEKEYSQTYPMLTKYLKNNVKSDVLNSRTIMEGLFIYSGRNLTSDQIEKAVTWGSGPNIVFRPDDPNTMYHLTDDGIGYYGNYDPISNTIYINEKFAKKIEEILSGSGTEEEKLAALFEFYGTLLHETTHYGDYLDGLQTDGDVGTKFDMEILESINPKIGTGDMIKMRKGLIHHDSKDLIKYHREAGSTDVLPTLVN
jgi:RHS repeat-associated protein